MATLPETERLEVVLLLQVYDPYEHYIVGIFSDEDHANAYEAANPLRMGHYEQEWWTVNGESHADAGE